MQQKNNSKRTTMWICTTAMFMALNVAMSSFGVPVPGGHLYMNDIVICLAGTGTPKELIATLRAINIAVVHIHIVVLFELFFCCIIVPPCIFIESIT